MTAISNGFTRAVFGPRDEVLEKILHSSLGEAGLPTIQVDDNAARMLQLLTRVHAPRRVLEIGTLFGYSGIHIARGLPEEGRLTTLEIDPEAASVAARNFELAGVADKVDIVVGDALAYLKTVEPESVGMLFIDADKKSYTRYLKSGFPLLEPGGLLVADDVLAGGDYSAESAEGDERREIEEILAYTRAVGRSSRLFSAFAGTENGLLISCKEH